MRIGVDLGGTKIEVVVIDDAGTELLRHRIPTPRGTYEGILDGLVGIVREAESRLASLGHAGPHTVGAGIPGAISPRTGLAMNANSTEINGRPLKQDLETALEGVLGVFSTERDPPGARHQQGPVVPDQLDRGATAGRLTRQHRRSARPFRALFSLQLFGRFHRGPPSPSFIRFPFPTIPVSRDCRYDPRVRQHPRPRR